MAIKLEMDIVSVVIQKQKKKKKKVLEVPVLELPLINQVYHTQSHLMLLQFFQ